MRISIVSIVAMIRGEVYICLTSSLMNFEGEVHSQAQGIRPASNQPTRRKAAAPAKKKPRREGSDVKEVLRTERLVLRETENSDFKEIYAMLSDPLVMAHYPRTRNGEESREWIDWVRAGYAEFGFCFWTVALAESGEFLGQCGILVQKVDGTREFEVGYLFKRSAWHHGYATEAARACRDYAFDALDCAHVISLIRPANLPSRAVAERNGMTIWKTTTFHGLEALVYRIDRRARSKDAKTASTTRE